LGPMPRLSRLTIFIIGAVLGLVLWLIPASFFGLSEPWDAEGPAYVVALLAAGLLVGFLGPNQLFAAVTGLFAGQLVVLLGRVLAHPGSDGLWMVGVVFLAGYTFVAAGIGAALGSGLRRRLAPVPRGEDRRSG
jgi:hypothetical protein